MGRDVMPVADASGALVGRVSVKGIMEHGRSFA
jgi:osmoprotectant transport system ATP-binding protein